MRNRWFLDIINYEIWRFVNYSKGKLIYEMHTLICKDKDMKNNLK